MSFVLWHDAARDAYDRCSLLPTVGGMRLTGTAVVPDHGPGATARYIIDVDHAWCVRAVDVRFSAPGADERIQLRAPQPGRWWQGDTPLPQVEGCLDVGLGFTPVGLTPLVHRVGTVERVAAGERVTTDVLHLDLPDLAPERRTVAIERADDDAWFHHEHGEARRLGLGPGGLVSSYGDVWTAAAAG